MNSTQRQYFQDLEQMQQKAAEGLRIPTVCGLLDVVRNLYHDDAHFVLELLQNADDQHATVVQFRLRQEGLIFVHNAPRHFTISDPATHVEDQKAGRLGHINSLVSVGSSSKTAKLEDVAIGKFGLGFKSVLQYTDRPEIYDDTFRFAIEDTIVPHLINDDHPERKTGETLFYFPFKTSKLATACIEIAQKLQSLSNPLLFLNHLRRIEWDCDGLRGFYELEEVGRVEDGLRLESIVHDGIRPRIQEIWRFSQALPDSPQLSVAVAYFLTSDRQHIDTDRQYPLCCYFPTTLATPYAFAMQAPFMLTGNRETPMANNSHNMQMVQMLGELAARSLQEICAYGQQREVAYIDNNLTRLFDVADASQPLQGTRQMLSLEPVGQRLLAAIKTGRILWCDQRRQYLATGDSFVPEAEYMPEIYPAPLLAQVMRKPQAGWVLTHLNVKNRSDIAIRNALGIPSLNPEAILRELTKEEAILKRQTIEWFQNWYGSLLDVPRHWRGDAQAFLRYKPFILCEDGSLVAPFGPSAKGPQVHIAREGQILVPELKMVKQQVLADKKAAQFMRELGLGYVDDYSTAELLQLPIAANESQATDKRLEAISLLAEIFSQKLSEPQRSNLLKSIALKPVFPGLAMDGTVKFVDVNHIKLHNELNDIFFDGNREIVYHEPAKLELLLSVEKAAYISAMLHSLPMPKAPQFTRHKIAVTPINECKIPDGHRPAWYNQKKLEYEYFCRWHILGWRHFVKIKAEQIDPRQASEIILRLLRNQDFKDQYYYQYYGAWSPIEIPSEALDALRGAPWVAGATRELRELLELEVPSLSQTTADTLADMLAASVTIDDGTQKKFVEFLKSRRVLEDFKQEQVLDEQRKEVESATPCTLRWLKEILKLRQEYIKVDQDRQDIKMLVEALLASLESLATDAYSDLRQLLPPGINIVFGPPGTGKTTKIARTVAAALTKHPDGHILVLTPTNQAASVAAKRICQLGVQALRGISSANTEQVEKAANEGLEVFDNDSDVLPPVLCSTVHYFSKTYCNKEGCKLQDYPWDMIIVDEASMVTLDYVLLAIFKGSQANPGCTFYIVGDPLQLPAITNLDAEILERASLDVFNFYSFIGLKEFSTTPSGMSPEVLSRVEIRLLDQQFRSIPQLCSLTSRFAYGGKMHSARDMVAHPAVQLPSTALPPFHHPVSFVRFPVCKDVADNPSLTALDKLGGSNFNIYSALLVKEMLQHLFNQIASSENPNMPLNVGIITPYVAQKKLLSKLLNTNAIHHGTNIELTANTVHQFQGDEFDVVLLVLNPPNMSMQGPTLVNRQYLINVATSRAKDCLIVLYPDERCGLPTAEFRHVNIRSNEPHNLEGLAQEITGKPVGTITFEAADLEHQMFGASDFLAQHCSVGLHQDVNYHAPEASMRYRFVKNGASATIDILTTLNTNIRD